jgi:hypothetical protein
MDTAKLLTTQTHYSLLKSLEAGFELPCLNHACATRRPGKADETGSFSSRVRSILLEDLQDQWYGPQGDFFSLT